MTHELKIRKQWADAKLAGEKPFEIRINDRGFQKGDVIRYKVIDPKTNEPWRVPTGELPLDGNDRHPLERCDFIITYVIEGKEGLERNYCVFADQPVPKKTMSFVPDTLWEKSSLKMAERIANDPPLCLSAFDHAREGTDFSCPGLSSEGIHCTRGKGECCHQEKRPVSADLGSGATPSNGTAEPLAPPSPLAETSGKEVHTDAESVPKEPEEHKWPCKHVRAAEPLARPVKDHGCLGYEPDHSIPPEKDSLHWKD